MITLNDIKKIDINQLSNKEIVDLRNKLINLDEDELTNIIFHIMDKYINIKLKNEYNNTQIRKDTTHEEFFNMCDDDYNVNIDILFNDKKIMSIFDTLHDKIKTKDSIHTIIGKTIK